MLAKFTGLKMPTFDDYIVPVDQIRYIEDMGDNDDE